MNGGLEVSGPDILSFYGKGGRVRWEGGQGELEGQQRTLDHAGPVPRTPWRSHGGAGFSVRACALWSDVLFLSLAS